MTAGLHAVVDGPPEGPVLVLGSSLGTTGAMWQPQVPALAARLRVIRYDHLGHGGSPVPPGPYTIDLLGRKVLRLLDDLGVGRVHYAGLSLGGMVGMWLAAHAPERIDRLALLCTSASLGPADGWRARAATVRAGRLDTIADTIVERWFTPGFAAAHPETVAAYRDLLTAVPTAGYAACCEAIAGMDLRADLAAVRAPTLVIGAADDLATPPVHAAAIAERIPSARLAVLDGAAHLANVEQPEAVTRLLTAHFDPEGTASR
ncbi:3-oxoadipate enol-lactonase [Micromonospora phaseoli]|uniref:3-oxoadipate enol-lactonase n=1 Tax=Micromonospora phaseoli TaxID=1144548 RepID=A0A1H6UEJ5_9ACTN|nr:3-oxoadipate enol-lactonase [Micromonospora phaseoli]PZV98989.1 3-oxoadipate enol-lactonase [Micromonospora phaseoli]GIJ76260.1 3-oxoadipate enol-lactonase [Micromonospora phaseoli]SEI90823.1 3-oxoadipate enol-lactonase [Micromonospora phaseoli]